MSGLDPDTDEPIDYRAQYEAAGLGPEKGPVDFWGCVGCAVFIGLSACFWAVVIVIVDWVWW